MSGENILKQIKLEQISPITDLNFRFEEVGELLCQSIKKYGMLTPVLVLADGEGYKLLAGFRRYKAARKNGLSEVPALCINSELSKADCLVISVSSNLNHEWSDFERLSCIRVAKDTCAINSKEIISDLLPLLGLQPSEHIFSEYYVFSKMDSSILTAIGEKTINIRACKGLSLFTTEQQKDFYDRVLSHVSLSVNDIMRLSEWISDLLASKKIDLNEFLSTEILSQVLANEKWDKQIRGQQFVKEVRNMKFPRLTEREVLFNRVANSIDSQTKEVSVEAPLSFEAEGFTIKAKVQNAESIEHIMNLLGNNKKLLNSLFDIML